MFNIYFKLFYFSPFSFCSMTCRYLFIRMKKIVFYKLNMFVYELPFPILGIFSIIAICFVYFVWYLMFLFCSFYFIGRFFQSYFNFRFNFRLWIFLMLLYKVFSWVFWIRINLKRIRQKISFHNCRNRICFIICWIFWCFWHWNVGKLLQKLRGLRHRRWRNKNIIIFSLFRFFMY